MAYRRATDVGGGDLAPAIGGAIQAQKMTAIGKFAASGAQLKRQNIRYADTINREIQAQKNLATQEAIADRIRREEAWGYAGKAGSEGLVEGLALGASQIGGRQYDYNPAGYGDTTLTRRQMSISGLQ